MAAGDQAAMERWAGLALAASAILALIFANSGFSGAYSAILGFPIQVAIGDFAIAKPLLLWVNDGLMAIFFLLVGLEIKREFLAGELSDWRRALLPLIAACGGFAVPALLFVALNIGSPQNFAAWAVPTATDIAFVVGLIAALGRLVPFSLKVFVLAIAIIDDLMAVVVIAVFYTAKLSLPMLGLAMVCLAILVAFNRLGVRRIAAYMLVGIVMWALVLKSGIHATLAGVVMGLFIPLHTKSGATPLEDLEHGLQPWVSFLIVPIFAFANAGLPLAGMGLDALFVPLTMGIIIGLFVGKQFGILGATWLAVRAGLSPRPAGSTWLQIYGVAILCGIGFTMSLFIGSLSFSDPVLQDRLRLGVIVGSLASAIFGVLVLWIAAKRTLIRPDVSS
jgi:NhaA family Na+:H+ antiporter